MSPLSPSDEAELRAMIPAMEAAWRSHDAGAYAAQFTPDAEHVNAYGMWWRGRAEIGEGWRIRYFQSTFVNPGVPHAR
jgi:uncharacterized protein (TIGR02246 family)